MYYVWTHPLLINYIFVPFYLLFDQNRQEFPFVNLWLISSHFRYNMHYHHKQHK